MTGLANTNSGDVTGNHGSDDLWVVQIDSAGSLIQQHCYGGTQSEQAHSIIRSDDGSLVLAGWTTSSDGDALFNNGMEDFWVIKTDTLFDGLEENIFEKDLVIISPNPFMDKATIKISEKFFLSNTPLKFIMTDLQGRQTGRIVNITSPEFILIKGELQDGMYFYGIENEKELIYSGKIIIR